MKKIIFILFLLPFFAHSQVEIITFKGDTIKGYLFKRDDKFLYFKDNPNDQACYVLRLTKVKEINYLVIGKPNNDPLGKPNNDPLVKPNEKFDQESFDNYLKIADRKLKGATACLALSLSSSIAGPLIIYLNPTDKNAIYLGSGISIAGFVLLYVGIFDIITATTKIGNAVYKLSPQGLTIKF